MWCVIYLYWHEPKEILIPHLLPSLLVFDLISPNYSLTLAITLSFLIDEECWEHSSLSADVCVQSLKWQTTQNLSMSRGLPLNSSQGHIINLISCFFKFCAKFDTHALFHALRHQKCRAWHKHQCLLVVIALDWMALLRFADWGYAGTHEDTFRKAPTQCHVRY
jgi:hypothetical protein